MRQTETDIFLYSWNCQRVFDQFDVRGHAENANIRDRRIHSFEIKIPNKEIIEIYIWSFNKHETRTRLFLYTYIMTKFV